MNWRKSSRSGAQGGGNCVEVAAAAGRVFVRDSKAPTGGMLCVSQEEWTRFLGALR